MSTGGQGINVGGIYADLDINSGNLDRGLAKARQALAAVDAEVLRLEAELQRGAISLTDYNARMLALNDTALQLTTRMNSAYTATQTLSTGLEIVNARAAQLGNGAGRVAMGMMQLGYIADDLQYGFKAIVNNIAPAVYSFTGNAGLAAGAQVAGVAVYQLTTRWDDLMGALGAATPTPALEGLKAIEAALKAVNKEIDDLRKKSFLTEVQLGNLETAERMLKALEATQKEEKAVESMNGPTKEDRARGAAFIDAIREQGGGDFVRGVLADEYRKRAEGEEGSNLNDVEIAKKMQQAGVFGASGGLDPSILKDAKHFNRERMNALARSLGLDAGFDDVDDAELARGKDAQDIIRDRLRRQRFLFDDVTGRMMTPDEMARSNLAEGGRGDAAAADAVGAVLDRRFGQRTTVDTANGKVDAFTPSVFSQNFNENSPEGKERAADRKAQLDAIEKQRKLTEKEEDERQDLIINEAEASGKRNAATRRKNAQKRRQNEQDSREAAPGIDSIGEALAGHARLGNITPAEAQSRIAAYLKEHGRNDKQAGAAAEDIYADSARKVEEGMVGRYLGGRTEKSNVESFSADEVASKFQASVGGGGNDPQEKTNGILEEIRKGIDKMADKQGLTVRFQ